MAPAHPRPWFDRLTMSGFGWDLLRKGVGLSECLEVGTVEVVGGDVDLENGFQLAL